MIDIDSLKTFLTVSETGSFSKAAEQLYLTQPAISKRVAGLESSLHTRLFDRLGRSVTLTEAGHILRRRARQIVQELDDSRREIANLSTEISGDLRMATSHHIGLHRLPPILREFTAQHPHVELDLSFVDSESALRAVEDGTLEIAVVTLPIKNTPGINSETIWRDNLQFVAYSQHPLAQLTEPLTLQTLSTYQAILPAPNTHTRQLVDSLFAKNELQIQTRLSTNYLETIKMLVSIGLGWSVLPEIMLSSELKVLDITGKRIQRQLGIVWHPARTLSNAAKVMMALCRNYAD